MTFEIRSGDTSTWYLPQMRLNITGRQAPRVQRDDPVAEPVQAGLRLPHILGFGAAGPDPRHVEIDGADIGEQRLWGAPVAIVRRAATHRVMLPARACAKAVAPGIPPGLRCSSSRN